MIVYTVRTARDNHPAGVFQLIERRFASEDFGRYAEFPDFAGYEMAILATGVQYCDLSVHGPKLGRAVRALSAVALQNCGYFFVLSAIIFFALLSRAWALGSASMAAWTSGSVLISYFWLSS